MKYMSCQLFHKIALFVDELNVNRFKIENFKSKNGSSYGIDVMHNNYLHNGKYSIP